MPNKKIDDDEVPNLHNETISQDDISEDEVSSIRESLESNTEEVEKSNKFVTGFRPNPPPKKSWWDKLEKKFHGGDTVVPVTWDGNLKRVCRICCPGPKLNTYYVKISEIRDESLVDGASYKLAPEGTVYTPYMDEYTKWKYEQDLKKKLKV